jgi:hypothetical protein
MRRRSERRNGIIVTMGCAALGPVLLLIGRPRWEPDPDPLASF